MIPRPRNLILAFALVFAMGLAVAVALLCIPAAKDEPAESSVPASPGTSLAITEESATSSPALFPIPEESSGLQFRSRGDGTCILTGISPTADACVVIPAYTKSGERVTEIAPRAFFGNPTVTAIQIPATVSVIGPLAFSACESLMYLSVSPDNLSFCDVSGVLYTKDRTTLLLYPPRRAGGVAEIGIETLGVADMAFYGCVYLNSVRYTGSAEAWESINIGSKNYSLTAAAKEFLG